ncbi:MAG TPA: hypothetical protein VKQ70_01225, partial [Caulobacteraceae bacterium]|nr:hypothetical protein [Caulobacteraceae bacterium]
MKRWWLSMGVVLGVMLAVAGPCRADVVGTIVGPASRSYPVAIAPLKNLSAGAGADVGMRFADIIGRDLTVAGYFKVLDRAAYIEKPEASGYTVDDINFESWSAIGAMALVKGAYTVEGDNLTLEARLFDVYQRKLLTGRRYHGPVAEVRRMANKFADEIMKQFTGERGPFDARLAFISTRDSRLSEIYVMSIDEGDLQEITKGQTVAKAPSWSPDSRTLLYTSYKRHNPDL